MPGKRLDVRTRSSALIPIYGVTLVDVLGTMIMVPLLPYLAYAPPHERGAIMGFNDSANNLALIVAPVLGGEAIDVNPHLVGVVPALAAFAAFAIGLWRER
jgi:predicted MFS family arabinose efflux permease